MRYIFSLILFLLLWNSSYSQKKEVRDTIKQKDIGLPFYYKQLIIPAAFITYGLTSIESDYLKLLNTELRNELRESIDEKFTIDDFSQYAPVATVYLLNNVGVKGKHNLKDRTLIYASSYLLMSAQVIALKSVSRVERPDGSSNNSFPSGHTATAFSGAEFLWQEYKDVNIWYGISGYAVAAGTGFFRIYNGRHWLSDVAMGAGIGILSTKLAYWMFPLQKRIFKSERNIGSAIMPFYDGKKLGVGLCLQLH